MGFQRVGRWADASANHDQVCKLAGIIFGEAPAAVAAHGKPREIGALRVAGEFFYRGIERGDREILHRRMKPPEILRALRHYHDGGNSAASVADGRPDAHVRFEQAVVATLASAVKKKYHRPLLVGVPVIRHENLILVSGALHGDGAIEKSCVVFSCVSRSGSQWR